MSRYGWSSLSTRVCIALYGLTLLSEVGAEAGCPPGTVEIRRETVGRDVNLYCESISRLSATQLSTIDPTAVRALSPADRRHLERRRSTTRLPEVDPAAWASPEWLAHARAKRDELIAARARLMRERTQLEQAGAPLMGLAVDNANLTRDLLYDDIAHTLTVIKEFGNALGQAGGLPAPMAASLDSLVTVAQADVYAMAAARSADPVRQADKVTDSAVAIKNLFLPALTGLTPEEAKAIRRATDALAKLTKSAQHWSSGEKLDRKAIANHADNIVDALSDLRVLQWLKAARSTSHMIGAEVALRFLEADRTALETVFFQNQNARSYCDSRIARIDEFLAIYERHLSPERQ